MQRTGDPKTEQLTNSSKSTFCPNHFIELHNISNSQIKMCKTAYLRILLLLQSKLGKKQFCILRLQGSATGPKKDLEILLEKEFQEPFQMDPVPPIQFNFALKEVIFIWQGNIVLHR